MEPTDEQIAALEERVAQLKLEHRDLDGVINQLSLDPKQDELQVRRLKRRRLLLKDQIVLLERQITPDSRA